MKKLDGLSTFLISLYTIQCGAVLAAVTGPDETVPVLGVGLSLMVLLAEGLLIASCMPRQRKPV